MTAATTEIPLTWQCAGCKTTWPVQMGWKCTCCRGWGIGKRVCSCTDTTGKLPHYPPTEIVGLVEDEKQGQWESTDVRCGECALAMAEAEGF